jgi:TPR repeat protein
MACEHCRWTESGEPNPMRAAYEAYELKDFDRAFEQLRPFLDTGDVFALCLAGTMWQLGIGTSMDLTSAEAAFRSAAAQGCPVAWHNLGTLALVRGPGSYEECDSARECYRMAESLGLDVGRPRLADSE